MEELYKRYSAARGISTDTRSIEEGQIFFALKGDNFDANNFVDEALKKGASLVVTQNPEFKTHADCYYCENTLETLQKLASYHRSKLDIPVIAITGTNGKTTTKELCGTALSCAGNTFFTQGNLNNHIGVPLSLLSVKKHHEYAIIEMGANHIGEIEALCKIANPDFGLITNIGKAHLEGFGSFDGVVQAKTELYRYIEAKNGRVFVNEDDHTLLYESEGINSVFYGRKKYAVEEFRGEFLLSFSWQVDQETHVLNSNLTGSYNLPNFIAAIALGLYFGASAVSINKALSDYVPVNKRSQIQKTERNTLVVDAYNANPSSMELALGNFETLDADTKVLILGDMLELGKDSKKEHGDIISKAMDLNASLNIFIGREFMQFSKDFSNAKFFNTSDEAARFLDSENLSNALVLIKGSRGIRCENVIPSL